MNESKPTPAWRVLQQARPLRLVVRRFEVHDSRSWNPYSKYWHEVLECGHHLVEFNVMPDALPAKRRWCLECAEERLNARDRWESLAGKAA